MPQNGIAAVEAPRIRDAGNLSPQRTDVRNEGFENGVGPFLCPHAQMPSEQHTWGDPARSAISFL